MLPVVVVEGAVVKPGVERSVELFRRTWGENVADGVVPGEFASVDFADAFRRR
ncbi:hypothetical protein ACWEVP_47435 [Amycolatopsis sp. NPDC003865]